MRKRRRSYRTSTIVLAPCADQGVKRTTRALQYSAYRLNAAKVTVMTSKSSTFLCLYLLAQLLFSARVSFAFYFRGNGLETRYPTTTTKPHRQLFLESVARVEVPDDLTCEELVSRFQDVLAYFTSLPVGHPAVAQFTDTYTPQLSLLRGRLSDLHLNRCRVSPSTRTAAGNGLFATRDIRVGELITMFPADAILFRDAEMEEVSGVIYGNAPTARSSSLTGDAARSYEIRVSSLHSIVGDSSMINDSAYLGHIANDGACLTEGDDKSRTLYSQRSADDANGVFRDLYQGCHMGLFSLRPIPNGEEIFVSYGEGYWLSRGSNEAYGEAQRGDERRRRRKMPKTNAKNQHKKGASPGKGF